MNKLVRVAFFAIFLSIFLFSLYALDPFLAMLSSASLAYVLSELYTDKKEPFELTKRQKDILNLLSQGYSVSEVSRFLNLDRKTIYRELKDIVNLLKDEI
ncbi:MAG: helix-turn-helix domain-containing protein [Candidatus Korarchaeum sp.]|nr:helix-turn-helix domain-containing protein [Candidatus Korarchaeum sp.]MDW8093340.1 helix-turn-helix domain-containing protein [Nitrososphaerota archaeon]